MLYRSLPIALLTSVINALVLALIQYPLIPAPIVVSWAAAVALLTLWRIVGYVRFLRYPPTLAAVPAWKRRFIAEVLLSGMLWGSAAILLYPAQDVLHQMFLVFMLAGMGAGAITTLSAVWLAALAYLIPSLLPLIVRLFMAETAVSMPMGLMATLFLVMVSLAALRGRNNVIELSQARHAQAQADTDLRLAATTFHSQEGILIADRYGRILRLNEAAKRITGHTQDELLGQPARQLLETEGSHASFDHDAMGAALRDNGFWAGECRLLTREGIGIPARATVTTVRDDHGDVSHYVAHFQDVSETKRAQERIEFQAYYDALTELPNRWLLSDRLEQDISRCRRHGHHGAVLFIDLDHFKRINDALGYRAGDGLLKSVAQRLIDNTRREDLAARFGGDEFVIVLTGLDDDPARAASQAERAAAKLRAALAEPYVHDGNHLHLTASVGIAPYPIDQADAETMITRADVALYHVKQRERGTQATYRPDMRDAIRARLDLETTLRQALEKDEFALVFQPQVDDGRVVGAEALLRWNRPGHGTVAPQQFIPVAEESGLILPIGDWVLKTACVKLAHWRRIFAGNRLPPLSVNVSSRQFFQANFVERVLSQLQASGIEGDALELELTESVLLDDFADACSKMQQLTSHGVRFALDDFGTGYSSLRYLQQLPITTLKIDRSFVHGLEAESGNAAIIRSIVSMAEHLRLNVVAEGVETAEEAELLNALNCHIHQGYRYSMPLDEAGYLAWLESGFGTQRS